MGIQKLLIFLSRKPGQAGEETVELPVIRDAMCRHSHKYPIYSTTRAWLIETA